MVGPTLEIAPPVRKPRRGGLGPVAEFRPNSRLAVAENVVFQSNGCDFPNTEENRCYTDAAVADKNFDGIDIQNAIGAPFTMYAGVQCFAGPDPDFDARALSTLDQGRDRVLEQEIAEWAAGGTLLTGTTSVKSAVAAIEQALDDDYLGLGLILMSRADALDAGLEYSEGDPLYTKNGTPVVASGRIARGEVYGVGGVTVEHGDQRVVDVIHPTTNKHWALAEQVFAIAVDCEYRVRAATA